MWLILSLVLVAQYKGALSAPVGAPPLEDYDDFLHSFSLFHPSLATPAAEPPDTVPVIHLPVTGGDMRKVSAEHYLDLFPPDLRPIDVKIIEHKDFIDYEVEFLELPENDYDIDFLESSPSVFLKPASQTPSRVSVATEKTTTTVSDWTLSQGITVDSFVNLLNAARQHLGNNKNDENDNNAKDTTVKNNPDSTTERSEITTQANYFLQTTNTIPATANNNANNQSPITSSSAQSSSRRSFPINPNKRRNRIQPLNTTIKPRRQGEALPFSPGSPRQKDHTHALLKQTNTKMTQRLSNIGRSTTVKAMDESGTTSVGESNQKYAIGATSSLSKADSSFKMIETSTTTTDMPTMSPTRTTTLSLIDSLRQQLKSISSSVLTTQSPIKNNHMPITLPDDKELMIDTQQEQSAKAEDQQSGPGVNDRIVDPQIGLLDKTEEITTTTENSNTVSEFQREDVTTFPPATTTTETKMTKSWVKNRDTAIMEGNTPTLPTTTIITDTMDNLSVGSSPSHTQTVTDITTNDPLSLSGEKTKNLGDETTTEWTFHQQISEELNINEVPRSTGTMFKSANIEQLVVKEDKGTDEAQQDEINLTVSPDPARILNGQYHEINPGQYHEVNPGQYHEINPGQYHEVHPGQYHEINPGQDVTAHPDNDYDDYNTQLDTIQVEMDQDLEEDTRIYNIKVKVGEFVVGEVGKINNGQTFGGVRYTVVDGEVDEQRIARILELFGTGFGKRITPSE